MMNLRSMKLLPAALTLLTVLAWNDVSAQVHPSNMRSGSLREFGTAPITIFTVPGGSYFVLTDIVWSVGPGPGTPGTASCNLYGNGIERWRIRGSYSNDGTTSFQSVPYQTHLTTGLAFDPGQVITFESTGHVGSYSLVWSGYVVSTTTAAMEPGIPSEASQILAQNEPNPFGPSTLIRYALPAPGPAEIRIYDSQGRKVRVLVEGTLEAGEHEVVWDGRNDANELLATGVYYYDIRTGQGSDQRKAVLVR